MRTLWRIKTVRARLLVAAIGIEAIMLSILVANSLRLLNEAMTSQAQLLADQISPVLQAALTAPLAQQDYATVQAVIDESNTLGALDYIAIIDVSKKVVASVGMDAASFSQEAEQTKRERNILHIQKQISYLGQPLGSLTFGLNLSQIFKAKQKFLSHGALIAAVEIGLSSLILFVVGVVITRHLAALTEASKKVADGDLTPEPVYEGDDDVGRLGAAFNTMSKAIYERVNELIAAKEAAEGSEKRLSTITHSANDGIFMIDPKGKISYWNPAAERLLGYCGEEAIGRNAAEIFFKEGESDQQLYALYAMLHSTGAVETGKTIELAVPRKEGSSTLIALSLSLVSLNGENHLVGIFRDILAMKTHEKELLQARQKAEESERAKTESVERLNLVMDGSNDGFWDWNIQTGEVVFSPRLVAMLGYAQTDLEPHVKAWERLVHPDDVATVTQALNKHLAGDTPFYETEHRLRTKPGEWLWVLDRGKVVERDQFGRPVRATGTHTDISKRKLAEAEVKRSEEHVLLLLNSTAEAIYGVDLEGNCTFANRSCLQVLGYATQSELLGKNMHQLIHHSRPDGSSFNQEECHIYNALFKGPGMYKGEDVFWRADGSSFPVECWAHPQKMNGSTIGGVITFYDITERRRAEHSLKKINEEMARSLQDLQARNREIALLGEMANMFQVCRSTKESFDLMNRLLPKVFLPYHGAFYIKNDLTGAMEPVAAWGDQRLAELTFDPDDCWGLRLGRPHKADDSPFETNCFHRCAFPGSHHACVPLISQSEMVGTFHLHHREKIPEDVFQLAKATADSLCLSLANIKLRDSLHEQSVNDALTGLYNRRYMEATLKRELQNAKRHGTFLSIILLDADHFKKINDIHGHDAGDAVLREIGKTLKSWVRAGDVPCRYGGEEFLVIMAGASQDIAASRGEQLRAACMKISVRTGDKALVRITVSIGVACYPTHGEDIDLLIKKADDALYEAKEQGRNRVMIATNPCGDPEVEQETPSSSTRS